MDNLSESEELELLQLQKAKALALGQGGMKPTFGNIAAVAPAIAKQVGNMMPIAHPVNNLPIIGGMAGMPFGLGAPGAALGEAAKEAADVVLEPDAVPKTPLGVGASVMGAGIMQEPKILGGIPGVSKYGAMAGNLASKFGKGVAKFGEALTGTKAKDLEQGAKQGLKTYLAPSMEKAQNIFGQALEKAGISARPPIEHIIDPQLQTARETALHVGTILDEGAALTAQEALLGRQAVDRIYNATPLMDRATRGHLADLRTMMDEELSKTSGPLKNASQIYRKAIVRSNLLNPFRVTKQGQYSAVAPMVATLAATAGTGSGHKTESGMGALGYLGASSPLVAGLAATSGGSAVKGLNAIASNPAARQALFQVLQRLATKKAQEKSPAVNGIRG